MERIVDPLTGKMENIFGQRGREILKLYIVNYSIGGGVCKSADEFSKKIQQIKDNISNTLSAKTYEIYINCFRVINDNLLGNKGDKNNGDEGESTKDKKGTNGDKKETNGDEKGVNEGD